MKTYEMFITTDSSPPPTWRYNISKPAATPTARGINIKVKVFAPAFINHAAIDPDGWVTLGENSTLRDLYRRLKLPLHLRLSFLYSINYEQARGDRELKDGDIVSFLFPVSGG